MDIVLFSQNFHDEERISYSRYMGTSRISCYRTVSNPDDYYPQGFNCFEKYPFKSVLNLSRSSCCLLLLLLGLGLDLENLLVDIGVSMGA